MEPMEPTLPPEWLTRSKKSLLRCQEWEEFQDQISASVDRQLAEGQLQQFTDLSEEGKQTLLQNALQSISQGESYKRISVRTSKILGEQIQHNIKYSATKLTAPHWERLQCEAHRGLFHLLQKWPDLKHKLYQCFNTPLPLSLRRPVWCIFLENSQAREDFLEKNRRDMQSTMSPHDLEIVKICDSLLQTEQTFKPLRVFKNTLHLMKAVLSYHHLRMRTSSRMVTSDFMLAVPFVYVTVASNPQASLTEIDTAVTIEQFLTFMDSRPVYMKESYTPEFETAWVEFTNQVISRLNEVDKDLFGHIRGVVKKDPLGEEASNFAEDLKAVMRPMVRALFVGYLSLDSALFVWDQYIIGLGAPNYDIIPVITALTFSLLRVQVLQCQTAEELASCLKKDANRLKKDYFMYEINKVFYQDLISSLTSRTVSVSTDYPVPWNVGIQGSELDDSDDRENIRLKELLNKETKKRKELQRQSAAEIEKMRKEIEELKRIVKKNEDVKKEVGDIYKPSTSK